MAKAATLALLLGALSCRPAAAQRQPRAVLIENFEGGAGAWKTNDGPAETSGKPSIAAVYAVTPGAPNVGGAQAGLIEFAAVSHRTWASATLPVDGAVWAKNGCTGLSLWVRADGSRPRITLALRSYPKGDSTLGEASYVREVPLDSSEWLQIRLPFALFKDKAGQPIGESHLRAVKLLQFIKIGSWPAFRFGVDEIRAEALPARRPEPAAEGALLVDFDAPGQVARLRHGVCLGSDAAELLTDADFSAKVKGNLSLLQRPVVRLKLSDYYQRDVGQVSTADVRRMLAWVRAWGGQPLLCLDEPLRKSGTAVDQAWRDFGRLCAELAKMRREEQGVHYYEIGSEPLLSGQFGTIEAATAAYNAIAAQVLMADPAARIGGMGFESAWDEQLRYFAEHARSLSFLSFHFFGAHSPVATDEDLFQAACRGRAGDLLHQMTLAEVRDLVWQRRGPNTQVWVTECALNSMREPDGRARDARTQTAFGAAWMAAFTLSATPYVDRVLWFKAFGGGWGLLKDDGTCAPGLFAAALLSDFAPGAATILGPIEPAKQTLVAPVSAPAGRYVFVANGSTPYALDLELRGTPTPRPARARRLDATTPTPTSDPIAPSSRQKLTLAGPGLAIFEAPTGG